MTPLPNIELGGGARKIDPNCFNLDPVHGLGEWKRKAQDIPWPVEDASIGNMRASHVMEHIPAGQDRIDVMNEAWRVLIPGGTLEIIVPFIVIPFDMVPPGLHPGPMWPAIADPTHVSFWCTESFSYFDGGMEPEASYGIKKWHTQSLTVRRGWEGCWVGTPRKE